MIRGLAQDLEQENAAESLSGIDPFSEVLDGAMIVASVFCISEILHFVVELLKLMS